MNRFRFRLQPLLDFRTRKEDGLKKDFSQALAALYREEDRLKTLHRDLESQLGEWEKMRGTMSDANDFIVYDHYLARLQKDIVGQIRQIKDQQQRVDKVRTQLVNATKDKRVLERLKEHQAADYSSRLAALEQKFLDEVGTRGYYNQTAVTT